MIVIPPIDTLLKLTHELKYLKAEESMTRVLRYKHIGNQEVQLEMDRRQTAVDVRRDEIEMEMAWIANLN